MIKSFEIKTEKGFIMLKKESGLRSGYIVYPTIFIFALVFTLIISFEDKNTQNIKSEKEILFVVNYMDKANLLIEQENNFNFDNIVNLKSNFFDVEDKTYKYFYKNTVVPQVRKGGYEDLFFAKDSDKLMLTSKNYNIPFCEALKRGLELKGNLYPFNFFMVKPIGSDPVKVYQYLTKSSEKYDIYINGKPMMENNFTCSDSNEILVKQK